MEITSKKRSELLKTLKSPFRLGDRFIVLGKNGYKFNIYRATSISKRTIGWKKHFSTILLNYDDVVKTATTGELPDSTSLHDCSIRIIDNHPNNYMPEKVIGDTFKVWQCTKDGITVRASNDTYHNVYYFVHGTYSVVPKKKMAWIANGQEIQKKVVEFGYHDQGRLHWITEDKITVADSLVHDSFKDACDMARKLGKIKIPVVR